MGNLETDSSTFSSLALSCPDEQEKFGGYSSALITSSTSSELTPKYVAADNLEISSSLGSSSLFVAPFFKPLMLERLEKAANVFTSLVLLSVTSA